MKHNFVVSLFGGFIGFGILLILLGTTGIVGASSADVRANVSRTNEVSATTPLSATFNYQGQLKNGGNPITATCDFQFSLWDSLSGGIQLGITQTISVVSVNAGYFTTLINSGNPFGVNAFNGSQRWLAIAVRCPAGGGSYTGLNPRQQLTAVPYALYSAAPWVTNGSDLSYMSGKVGIGTTSPSSSLEIAAQDGLAITGFQPFLTLRDTNNANKRSIIQGADGKIIFYPDSFIGGAPAMVINNLSGNVGIGTSSPQRTVHVSGANSGLRLQSTDSHYWTTTEYQTDSRTWHTGVGGSAVSNDVNSKYYIADATVSQFRMVIDTSGDVGIGTTNPLATLDVNGGIRGTGLTAPANLFLNASTGRIALRTTNGGPYAERMTILDNGNVGIGTTSPSDNLDVIGKSTVTGPDNNTDTIAFNVLNANGVSSFRVYDDGGVGINFPYSYINTTQIICMSNDAKHLLIPCGSAAEYVPSVDGVDGYPETADLVSIVSNGRNPYGDMHSPFVVQKTSTSCDANLLGFIVDPKSGASGKKLNDHYLPLAIYGYFPAKVTVENGAIKRGDPITSSSKPGYGMKATGACKIIGYALDDADHEGTIQVFANHGESTAPAVTSLQAQVKELKDQNASLDARLTALEQTSNGQTSTQSTPSRDVMVFGVLLIVGIVVGRRTTSGGRS